MSTGMELMGMKYCTRCDDPYTVTESDTGMCAGCLSSLALADLQAENARLRAALERAATFVESADDGAPLQCLADGIRAIGDPGPAALAGTEPKGGTT